MYVTSLLIWTRSTDTNTCIFSVREFAPTSSTTAFYAQLQILIFNLKTSCFGIKRTAQWYDRIPAIWTHWIAIVGLFKVYCGTYWISMPVTKCIECPYNVRVDNKWTTCPPEFLAIFRKASNSGILTKLSKLSIFSESHPSSL